MFQLLPIVLITALGLVQSSNAQFPPNVTYDTILKSPINPNITISYQTPDPGTCMTVFPTQKQYTGYVNLPPFTLEPYQQDYSINTFFWFVESRTDPQTAPLTIWLNGGPGSSSMFGFFTENGPCEVIPLPEGGYGTQPSLWGWDRSSNMLFIDQPTQVGLSYDDLMEASYNFSSDDYTAPPMSFDRPRFPSWAVSNGTFPTGRPQNTQNTSFIAASASWHFLQGFLAAFPQYNPGTRPNSTTTEPTGINLFVESYGGQYGPVFGDFFEKQNEKRNAGEIPPNTTFEIELTSLGIINGLVDPLIQGPWYPRFAHDNTYDIQVIDQTAELNALSAFQAPYGCKNLILQCRESVKINDPQGEGDDFFTNMLCAKADVECRQLLSIALSTDRNPYDIRVKGPDTAPSRAYLEYLNTADVQRSIGAKVNFTQSNRRVQSNFLATGDVVRGAPLTALASLLTKGIRVSFMYGDADIICNWFGGEQVSLELARLLPTYSTAFTAAGYVDIVVNNSYVGGQVRQYGNLSFARIYDAGHAIPAYQPETAFTVFARIIEGSDIGMGREIDPWTFRTSGPANSTHRNKVPEQPKHTCWFRDRFSTCNKDEIRQMDQSQGIVKDGIWYAKESDYTPSQRSPVIAGKPGSLPTNPPTQISTSTAFIPVTGVYTATATPRPTSHASSLRSPFRLRRGDNWPFALDSDNADTERKRAGRFKKAMIILASVLGGLSLL